MGWDGTLQSRILFGILFGRSDASSDDGRGEGSASYFPPAPPRSSPCRLALALAELVVEMASAADGKVDVDGEAGRGRGCLAGLELHARPAVWPPGPSLRSRPLCIPLGSPAPAGDAEVTLVSAEGERFVVPKRVAQLSELVKTMTDEGSGEEVPLMDVKVREWRRCGGRGLA